MSRFRPVALFGFFYAFTRIHAEPTAFSFDPSPDWYGVDGNWSSIRLYVGAPQQQVDVVVGTGLSEIWLAQDAPCKADAICSSSRGGLFDSAASASWSSLGAWKRPLDYLGYSGKSDYALENVVVLDGPTQTTTPLSWQVAAAFNGTDPYIGLFGLGIEDSSFDGDVKLSPIAALVQRDGLIPSHCYGYTAGAHYLGTTGTPMSLTLGGFDSSRFEPHDITFAMNTSTRRPEVLLRAITASVSDINQAPTAWATSSESLAFFNESTSALIDSSTPYLWLPQAICDRFAARFNLTWNSAFELYVFNGSESLEKFETAPDLSFTFTLSSINGPSDSEAPLEAPSVLNLTISATAFNQALGYPFMGLIDEGDPVVPYFPLRRADKDGPVVIGRAFLQEVYMITNYETESFTVYQARFPEDLASESTIVTVPSSGSGRYPGPPNEQGWTITQGQIAGIVVGATVIGITSIAAVLWLRRRKRSRTHFSSSGHDRSPGNAEQDIPRTGLWQFFPKVPILQHWRRNRMGRDTGLSGTTLRSTQRLSTKSYSRYETPTPTIPIEMTNWGMKVNESGAPFSARQYEDWTVFQPQQSRAGRTRSLIPGDRDSQVTLAQPAKTAQDISPMATYRPSDAVNQPAPLSPMPSSDTMSNYLQSPMTANPYGEAYYYGNIPSPIPLLHAETSSESSVASSPAGNETNFDRQNSTAGSLYEPTKATRRRSSSTHQEHQEGHSPQDTNIPDLILTDAFEFALPVMPSARAENRFSAADSLGSDFTVEEEEREAAWRAAGMQDRLDGPDLVHIPQPAERRYSWEGDH